MLNFTEIKENCPQAYARFVEWAWAKMKDRYTIQDYDLFQGNDSSIKPNLFNIRDLYDFFDEEEVFVNLCANLNTSSVEYDYCIDRFGDFGKVSKLYESRNKAEKHAFLKAFEVLESKL